MYTQARTALDRTATTLPMAWLARLICSATTASADGGWVAWARKSAWRKASTRSSRRSASQWALSRSRITV